MNDLDSIKQRLMREDPQQKFLATAQSFLALKEIQWPFWIQNKQEIQATASTVRNWSNELLKHSGLLK